MKKIKKLTLAILLLVFVGISSIQAQPSPGEGGDPGSGPPVSGGASAPIGGGAGILIALGLVYAANRYQVARNKEE